LLSALADHDCPARLSVAVFRLAPEHQFRLLLLPIEAPASDSCLAIGGTAAGSVLKDLSQGKPGDAISGAIRGAVVMTVIGMLRNAMMKR
jgi:hypothetical protein